MLGNRDKNLNNDEEVDTTINFREGDQVMVKLDTKAKEKSLGEVSLVREDGSTGNKIIEVKILEGENAGEIVEFSSSDTDDIELAA